MLQENISLKPYNTFGIDVLARYFATFDRVSSLKEILDVSEKGSLRRLVLGGGSNVLFTDDFDGIVLKNEIKGIDPLIKTVLISAYNVSELEISDKLNNGVRIDEVMHKPFSLIKLINTVNTLLEK